MLEARCPQCERRYHGVALTVNRPHYCDVCGKRLVIYEVLPKAGLKKLTKKSIWARLWKALKEDITWSIDRRGLL